MSAPRIGALRELAAEAELERRDFVYEATELLRRFLEANRARLREIGRLMLVDDEQDYLVYNPEDGTWTTRLTYRDPADGEWYDEQQVVEATSEIVELYNPADIFAWLIEAAKDPVAHLLPADELAAREQAAADDEEPDWQAELPPQQQETIAAQRLWQLADTYRSQLTAQQQQLLGDFVANAQDALKRTGDLVLLNEENDTLVLRADGRFETGLDLTDLPPASVDPEAAGHPGLTVTDARTVADFYDPADVLEWVTEALAERYPALDFSAVYD